MKRKFVFAFFVTICLILVSCGNEPAEIASPETVDVEQADLSNMDFSFSDRDISSNYDDVIQKDAILSEGVLFIDNEGCYVVSGNEVRQIIVRAGETDKVQIVLDQAVIQNDSGPCVLISSADKVFITAKAGTENLISDGKGYTLSENGSTVDGAIFSKADLTLNGDGMLKVVANNKHGIVSKDDLIIASLNLSVTSKNVGLNGKDCVKIKDAVLHVTGGSDAIRSDNADDVNRGFVLIEGGEVSLDSGNDGIQAETVIKIASSSLNVTSGGGSFASLSTSVESYKGLKAGSDIVIAGGNFIIDSKDDCIHSNHTITVESGIFSLSSGDDGIHADTDLAIIDGSFNISKSYEAMEATKIVISGGEYDLVSADDCLNAAGGNDASAIGGRPGMGSFSSGTGSIYIKGGYLKLDANGDGIDSNGAIVVSGGVLLISGPTSSGNGAFDYDSSASITGGTVIALGSSGMAQGFTAAEGQGAALVSFSAQSANVSIAVLDENNNVVCSFTPNKAYQCAVISCKGMQVGKTYRVYVGGTALKEDENGYAVSGNLDGGNSILEFTLSSELYNAGGINGQGGMGGGMGRPGGMGGGFDRPGGRKEF